MTTEIWRHERPKGLEPDWAFRVRADGKVIFSSRLVSVRPLSCEAAAWVAWMVAANQGSGRALVWHGNL